MSPTPSVVRLAAESTSRDRSQSFFPLRLLAAAALLLSASAQVVWPKDYLDNDHHAEPLPFIHSVAAGGAEQLWVAYGATPDAITISWLSSAAGAQSLVRYDTTPGTFAHSATGSAKTYTCGSYTSGDIHQVALTGLPLATRIYYKVGDDSTGASSERSFVTSPGVGAKYPYTFGVIGDLGQTDNSNSTMNHVLAAAHVDSVFLTGDVSYADSDQPRWDSFQRLADPLASSKPWMVASGNHASTRIKPLPPTRPPARHLSPPTNLPGLGQLVPPLHRKSRVCASSRPTRLASSACPRAAARTALFTTATRSRART